MTPIIDKKVLVVHIWYIYLYMAKPDLHWSKILTHIGNNDLKFWHAFDSMFWNFGMLLTQWSEILACFGFNDIFAHFGFIWSDILCSLWIRCSETLAHFGFNALKCWLTLVSMIWNVGSLWFQWSEILSHFGINEQKLWIQWFKRLNRIVVGEVGVIGSNAKTISKPHSYGGFIPRTLRMCIVKS